MFTKKDRQVSDIVLAIWLLLIAIQMVSSLISFKFDRFVFPELIMLKLIPFAYGPFVYIYAKMLVLEKPVFRVRYFFHFIPFALATLLFMIFVPKDVVLVEVNSSFLGEGTTDYHIFYAAAIIVSIIFYVIQVMYLLHAHEKKVYNYFSFDSHKTNLRWLKTIALIFALAYSLAIVSRLFNFFLEIKNPVFQPDIFPIIGLTFFAYALSFFGFNQETIFVSESFKRLQRRQDRLEAADIEEETKTNPKYERSGLKEQTALEYIDLIKQYMEKEQPYLQGDFTIEKMAHELNIQKHYITQVLNERLNKNFYTFVNEYRVEEVKLRLADKKHENLTLLALAYDSGFNSKSSFNTIFKKLTGQTPSEYKKSIATS